MQRVRDDCCADSPLTFDRQLRAGARFWREFLVPRSDLQTPIRKSELSFCRRIQRVRDDCCADSIATFDGQLRTGARFWREFLVPRSELQTPMREPEV